MPEISKYNKEGDSLYKRIETACSLCEARKEFERNLSSYVETRITFEDKLDQVVNLMNMLTLMEHEPGDVKPQLKEKIKNLLESGLSYDLTVEKHFNKMTQYSINLIPEIPGIYNLYSFWHGQELLARKPWHQYVDIKEAQDIYGKVGLLKEASLTVAEI